MTYQVLAESETGPQLATATLASSKQLVHVFTLLCHWPLGQIVQPGEPTPALYPRGQAEHTLLDVKAVK